MSTSAQLLASFRANPVDMTTPYRWADSVVYGWLSEAQREVCVRAGSIKDTTTADVCVIDVTEGTPTYAANSLIIRITRAFLVDADGNVSPLVIYDREEMDRIYPDWRTEVDTPTGLILEGGNVVLNRIPAADATVRLEVLRLPLDDIDATTPPEIPAIHHDELVNWALYRAHLIEDDDDEAPAGRWRKYLERFEAYFGRKPNADLKRKQAANRPHITKAWW